MACVRRIFQKAAYKTQFLANDALFTAGLRQTARILEGPGRRILVYHGLDRQGNKSLNGRFISAAEFESQLRFLSDHVQLVSLDDYFSEQFDTRRFAVAITFDDGYQNNIRYALPALEKHGAHAAFFLTGAAERGADWLWMDFLDVATRLGPPKVDIDGRAFYKRRWRHTRFYADAGGRKLVDWARYSPWSFVQKMENAFIEAGAWAGAGVWSEYWALLSPPEIRQLAASPYATVGVHGHTHQDLAFLPLETACQELRDAKAALEKICEQPIHTLAYPFGTYTRPLVEYAESIGFSHQLVMDFLHPEDYADPRLRERQVINPYISGGNQWLAVKRGGYG